MTFGLQCDEATSFAILDAAAEVGITFIDTADVYPLGGTPEIAGRTEEIVGNWLRGRREHFILATKCHGKMGPAPWQQGTSRKHVLSAIDASLKRLGTDYVDLYQIHQYDAATPIIGASKPDQLKASIAATSVKLDAAVKAKLDELTHEFRMGDAAR